MSPDISTYQQAAQSIYEPEKAAEASTLATNKQNTINTLESGKGQINADYQTAIDNLNTTLKANIGKINQLYTERLGGNFSGLQGNDLGGMFAQASKNQTGIETARATKLNDIAVGEENATNTYNTNVSNLNSEYQSLESQYANTNYNSALKEYNAQQLQQAKMAQSQSNSDRAYNLSVARFGNSQQQSAANAANNYKVKQLSSGNKAYTGPNGQTNLYDYASNVAAGDANRTYDIIKQELQTGSETDKGAYNGILKLEKQGLSKDQIIQRLSKSNAYIFQ